MLPDVHRAPPAPIESVPSLPHALIHEIGRSGYLESFGLGVALLAVAGVVVALSIAALVARLRRGRRLMPRAPRWLVNAGTTTLVVTLVISGVAVLVNNYVGYIPTLHALLHPPGSSLAVSGRQPHGLTNADASRVVRIHIPAPADGVPSGPAYVYLPPGYDEPGNATRRYPVIYLVHGTPGRPQDWFTAGGVQATMDLLIEHHLVGPMIVVSPTASTGYLDDDECLDVPGRFLLEHYLAVDVVRAVDRTFRTVPTRWERAIGGMSSGGFCSLNVGLHHLHRFSVILASEPYGDPGPHPLHDLLDGSWPAYRVNSPFFYVPLMRFSASVAVFLDSPSHDRTTTRNALQLARELSLAGQIAAYRQAAGQRHNWREARIELPYSLVFAWQHFRDLPPTGTDRADAEQFAAILRYAESLPPPRPRPNARPASRSPRPTVRPATTPTATATR